MPFNSLVQEKILDFEQLGIPEVFSFFQYKSPSETTLRR